MKKLLFILCLVPLLINGQQSFYLTRKVTDTNYTIRVTDTYISATATLTNFLPLATLFRSGQGVWIKESGGTNTVTVRAAGSDTINGTLADVTLNNGLAVLYVSDHTNNWEAFYSENQPFSYLNLTAGVLPYASAAAALSDSPVSRVNSTTVSLTNLVNSGTVVRGIQTLTGVATTTDWSLGNEFVWSLSGNSTNTHVNVPTTSATTQPLFLTVSSDGTRTLQFSFSGPTTNWTSGFVLTPRNGQTMYAFYPRGGTLDISASPDAYATADGQIYRRASSTNGFGAIDLTDSDAVGTSILGTANGGTGTTNGAPGVVGTMINTTANTVGAVPRATSTNPTNYVPSQVIIDGSGNVTGVTSLDTATLNVGTLNLTNALARSAIAAGTPSHLVINDGAGALSSEATLGATRFPALTGAIITAGGSLATTFGNNPAFGDSTLTSQTMTFNLSTATDPIAYATNNAFIFLNPLLLGDSGLAWNSDNDGSGTSITRGAANRLTFNCNGTQMGQFTANSFEATAIDLGSSSSARLTLESAGIIQMGVDASTPVDQALHGADASGTDRPGGVFDLAASRSTGTNAPGNVRIRTGSTGATGSSLNAYVTSLSLGGVLKVDMTTTGNIGAGEDDLISYTIPAGQLAKDLQFHEFEVFGTFAANANSAQVKLWFDGVAFFDTGSIVFNGLTWRAVGKIIRTGPATQKIEGEFGVSGTLLGALTTTTRFFATDTATLSGATIFKVTGQDTGGVPASNKVVQEGMIILQYQGQ